MDAARRGGVSWGMAEEAAMEEDLDSVTEGAMLGIITMLGSTNMLSTNPATSPQKCVFTLPRHFPVHISSVEMTSLKQNRCSGV